MGSTLLCQFLLLTLHVCLLATDYVIIVIVFYMKRKCNLFLKFLRCITSEYGKSCNESNLKDIKRTIIGESFIYYMSLAC